MIRERVLEEVPPGAELADETLQAMIDRTITELFPDEYIRLEEKRKLRHMVFNSIRRMDVLQDVLEDETITEIMVNGPHHIFVEQAGHLYETGLTFEHQTRLENIVQQIASRGNRIVNESNPILDARLEDGSRVNIVVPPIALAGLVLVGLGCAPIYPSIIHSTPDHFGADKSQAVIGIQMASAYVGNLTMPPLFGLLANNITPALFPFYLLALLVLMVCMHEQLVRKTRRS